MNSKEKIHGLLPLPPDERDFSHHKVFGTLGAPQIPNIDFDIAPQVIMLDQIDTDFCTGHAVSEDNTLLQGLASDPSLLDFLFREKKDSSLSARASLAYSFGLVASPAVYVDLAKKGLNADINTKLLEILQKKDGYPFFDPNWQMAKTKQIRGEYLEFGATLREAALSVVTYGSLLKSFSPFTHAEGKPTDRDRNFLANWNNWPADLEKKAAPFKAGSFWSVDGPLDMFDDIRSTLYINKTSNTPSGVIFGLAWRPEWTYSPGGVIKDNYTTPQGNGHCIYIRGQKIINGVPYLKIQNSYGPSVGDKGMFYFPRAVINREANYGAYTFKKMAVGDAQYMNENGIKVSDNWFVGILKAIFHMFDDIHESQP